MYDYMRALHARFCREPELQKVREELDQVYREIKARLGQQDQETLLQLADLENELREETSLASFIAGFQLGMGIAGEMERYCFEDEEEKRARNGLCSAGTWLQETLLPQLPTCPGTCRQQRVLLHPNRGCAATGRS